MGIAQPYQPLATIEVAGRSAPGQTESGDRYVAHATTEGLLVAVIDGLGHGPEAAASAQSVAQLLQTTENTSLISLAQLSHRRLRGQRGAVMSFAYIDPHQSTMTWLAVGNVQGTLLRRDPRAHPNQELLVLRGGVLGSRLPNLQVAIVPVWRGDLLLLVSDGIRAGFADHLPLGAEPQLIAETVLEKYWNGVDDGLVLAARFNDGFETYSAS